MSSRGSDVRASPSALRDVTRDAASQPSTVDRGPSLRGGAVDDSPRRELLRGVSHLHVDARRSSGTDGGSVLSPARGSHHQTVSSIRGQLGLTPEAPIVEGHEAHPSLAWPRLRVILREPFAEFFGTFILVLFGDGSVAQVVLSTALRAPGTTGFGDYQSINWGWGLGVMLGIYVAGDSGGFLNPAVTFGFCLFRNFPWRRLPIYFLAQLLGAFCASGVVYANYITAIDQVNGYGVRTVPPAAGATGGKSCIYT